MKITSKLAGTDVPAGTVTGGGVATLANVGADTLLDTSVTGTSSARISYGTGQGMNVFLGSPAWSCQFNMAAIGTDLQSFFGIGSVTVAGAGITYTTRHMGFKVVRAASGTNSLYATQGDNTTETASAALQTVAQDESVDLIMKVNAATSVDYYFRYNNGSLSAATNLTTNIPSGTVVSTLWYAVSNAAVATRTVIYIPFTHYER